MDLDGVNLPRLQALRRVVELGSLHAAAEHLGVSTSAVTQRVQALERAVRIPVLIRSRPVRATEAGLVLVELLRQVEALTADVDAQATTPSADRPEVALALEPGLAGSALSALTGLVDRWSIRIVEADATEAAELLRSGAVLGALVHDPQAVAGTAVTVLGEVRYRGVAAPHFASHHHIPHHERQQVAMRLQTAPLIAATADASAEDPAAQLLQLLSDAPEMASAGPTTRHILPAGGPHLAATVLGTGWAVMPEPQVAGAMSRGEVVDIAPQVHLSRTVSWQVWNLSIPAVADLTAAITAAASAITGAGASSPTQDDDTDHGRGTAGDRDLDEEGR